MQQAVKMLAWLCARNLRVCELVLVDGSYVNACEYLERFGSYIQSAFICETDSSNTLLVIATCCKNLRSLVHENSPVSGAFLDLLTACTRLESVLCSFPVICQPELLPRHATHHLQVHTLKLGCYKEAALSILGMCAPEYIQWLYLPCDVPNKHQFTGLRSLGVYFRIGINALLEILAHCPGLVNLDIRGMQGVLVDAEFGLVVRAVPNLRTLNIEGIYTLFNSSLHAIERFLKHSLEALYIRHCRFGAANINYLLSECSNLHTLSIESLEGVDCTLLGNITTLIVDFSEDENVWYAVQKHCRRLSCLYLELYDWYNNVSPMTEAVCDMPAMRTILFVDVSAHALDNLICALHRRNSSVSVLLEFNGGWYDLCWYDLHTLPI